MASEADIRCSWITVRPSWSASIGPSVVSTSGTFAPLLASIGPGIVCRKWRASPPPSAGFAALAQGGGERRVTQLSPKQGVEVQQDSGGSDHTVYTATPGIPGDSGSAFIDAQGRAFGVLSTLQIAPLPAGNGVGDVSREIAYMKSHGGPDLTLATGTEPFRGPLL